MIQTTDATYETAADALHAVENLRKGYADAIAIADAYNVDAHPDASTWRDDALDVAQGHLNRLRELQQEIAKYEAT